MIKIRENNQFKSFKLKYFVLLFILLLLILVVYFFLPVFSDPSTSFFQRKGEIVNAIKTREWQEGNNKFIDLSLKSSSGLMVDLTVLIPKEANTPRPLSIVLAGYGTGRRAPELISDSKGIVIAAISYPYYGDTKINDISQFISNVKKIQKGVIDTAPAVLLALEYLIKQPYVNPEKIELVGVSFGAFLASTPAALDNRIKRVWLVQGAADPASIFEYYLQNSLLNKSLRRIAASLLEFVIAGHYLKPELWVGKISPRPVIVINTRYDPTFPKESVATLHQSLGQPNEVIWLKGLHVTPGRKGVIQQLADLVFTRMASDHKINTTAN